MGRCKATERKRNTVSQSRIVLRDMISVPSDATYHAASQSRSKIKVFC
jgi:hypothetical protein